MSQKKPSLKYSQNFLETMNRKNQKFFCRDCGHSCFYHIFSWLEEVNNHLLPRLSMPAKWERVFGWFLDKLLLTLGILKIDDNFTESDIQLRTTCFIKEARKKGVQFKALKGPWGYTNHFQAQIRNKTIKFDGLPLVDFPDKDCSSLLEDKEKTKQKLTKAGFPVAPGKSFWFWQKRRALKFGRENLDFPLVVKPRSGSVSRHVTTNIQNKNRLRRAINKAIRYSPSFIIEKFLPNTFVHRATVVDFDLWLVLSKFQQI